MLSPHELDAVSMIRVQHLYKNFGKTSALTDLNLSVEKGQIYGLVGPDGAGKTTAIRLMCGALLPSAAVQGQVTTIEIGGYDLVQNPEGARLNLGYLPQRFSLYEELTVLENLRFFAEVRGLPTESWRSRCLDILKFVGLDEFTSRRAGYLSGGMKQKLGLAAGLVHTPQVLLLDEPTTGVDPVTRQDFWKLIIRLVEEDETTVLISTPYMDEASRCQQVGFIKDGKLLMEGPPNALCQQLDGEVIELRGEPLADLRILARKVPGVVDAHMFGSRIHLRVEAGKAKKVIRRLEKRISKEGLELRSIQKVPAQLEDVFMAVLRG